VERQRPVRRSFSEICRNVWRESVTDRTMLAASGLAFFAMFALLPAIAGVGALYALIADPKRLERQLAMLEGELPGGVVDILREFVTTVPAGLGFGAGLFLNLLIVLWTVQRSASGIITALNIVHNTQEKRGRWRRERAALAVAGGSLLFLFLSLFLIALLPLFGSALDADLRTTFTVLRWPLLAVLFLAYLSAVYRIAPAEPPRRFSWISIGSGVALALWLAATGLFSLYLNHVGGFGAYYGSATAPVVLMTWLFLSSWVVMIGAEVNEQVVETKEGTTREDVKERVDRA
jgi:membrane protein